MTACSPTVPLSPGFEYELVAEDPDAVDSFWLSIPCKRPPDDGGDLAVYVKRTHEGVIVDVLPGNSDGINDSLGSVAVGFADATMVEMAA